jgi:hypothetical protein
VTAGWPGPVTLLERGTKFRERFSSLEDWVFKPDSVLSGEGGAGFLADAKLCLSSEAGAKFLGEMAARYPRALQDVDFHIYQHLLDLGHEIRRAMPNEAQLRVNSRRLSALGLTLVSYPVRPLGSDMAAAFLGRFVGAIVNHQAQIQYGVHVKAVSLDSRAGTYRLTAAVDGGEQEYTCSHLFLAVGWAGSEWLLKIGSALGLTVYPNHVDVGVRLEFPLFAGQQLKELGDNPKIKCFDSKSYCKTHCLVHSGRAFYFEFGNQSLVDAHAVRRRASVASSINLLYRVTTDQVRDPLQVFRGISATVGQFGSDRPLAMPLDDFLENRNLPESGATFEPTLHSAVECDLSLVLPARVLAGIRELIARLSRFAPGIATNRAILYAPAVQWVMPRIELGPCFDVPGKDHLYCIGDCTGQTAGVLPAAVSGVIAARHAVRGLTGDPQLAFWEF